jgi:hypothetical protein
LVDNTIVKEKEIFIPTEDWLGVIESDSVPTYLNDKELRKDGFIQITPETLGEYGVNPNNSTAVVGFYQIRDLGDFYTNEFEAEFDAPRRPMTDFRFLPLTEPRPPLRYLTFAPQSLIIS